MKVITLFAKPLVLLKADPVLHGGRAGCSLVQPPSGLDFLPVVPLPARQQRQPDRRWLLGSSSRSSPGSETTFSRCEICVTQNVCCNSRGPLLAVRGYNLN